MYVECDSNRVLKGPSALQLGIFMGCATNASPIEIYLPSLYFCSLLKSNTLNDFFKE